MVAQAQHLPTINGWSGLFPPDWNFYDTNAADYEQRATRWAVKRGFVGNLCRVDVESGTWTLATQGRDLICASRSCPISFGQSHEFEINLQQGGNSAPFEDDGWVGPEPWGQWTGAAQAALSFTVWPPRGLGFALLVRGLVSADAPNQSIWLEANQCPIGDLEFDLAHGSGPQIISGTIPTKCIDADGRIVLRINTDRMRGPRALGINDDDRLLGVGVEYLIIRG